MRNELVVWLFGDPVGTLTSTAGRLAFTYHPEWLARPDAVPVSGALPLQPEPFDDQRTRPYFAGLRRQAQCILSASSALLHHNAARRITGAK